MGTKIVQGRPFTEQDSATSLPVAVVNRTFARRFFKGDSALGKHFGFDVDLKKFGDFEIIGVTEDTKYRDPAKETPPMFFLPSTQSVTFDDPRGVAFDEESHVLNAVELSTFGRVPNLEADVRRALAEVNPDLAVIDFRSFENQVDNAFSRQTMITTLTSLFGLLALVLASVGIYGVTAYSVERRTNEIGVRMALGAERGDVLRLVLREGGKLALIGVAIGLVGAIGLTRLMRDLLYGVSPTDPLTFAGVATLLIAVALAACYIPARRATRVDPAVALRHE
jgi:predicted permease